MSKHFDEFYFGKFARERAANVLTFNALQTDRQVSDAQQVSTSVHAAG